MKLILPTVAYWTDFEDLICKLFKNKYPGETVQKYGRSGQYQAGVDVFVEDSYIGVQCKKKDKLAGSNLKTDEIKEEVEKAKNYNPNLKKYIICYTGQRDNSLQDKVKEINELHKKNSPPLFKVELMSWEEISEEIQSFPDLLMEYLGDVLRRVQEITKANAKVSLNKILSNILTEFEGTDGKPHMTLYSSQLIELLKYLDDDLVIKVNQLLGEIEAYVPENAMDRLIFGEPHGRNPRGPIKTKLRRLVEETAKQ